MAAPVVACLDVEGYLQAPGSRVFNRGAADMLEGGLLAFGSGSAVVVVEVQQLQQAGVLQGAHRGASVTAVKWQPDCHGRELRGVGQLTLASGDSEGGALVWDVPSASVLARMADVPAARDALRERPGGKAAVAGLAWVLPRPGVLAVVLAPATLLLWDTKARSLLWRKDISATEAIAGLATDPLDLRRLCLTSDRGMLLVLTLTDPESGRVEQQQYRVNMPQQPASQLPQHGEQGAHRTPGKDAAASAAGAAASAAGAALQAHFCVTRDLLLVMLPRELLVFDLELGVPASSRPLPAGKSPFAALLGAFGEGVTAGGGDEGGLDFIYCTHQDGSLSTWVRTPGELRFSMGASVRLTPQAVRDSHMPQPQLLATCAQMWRRRLLGDDAAARCQTAAATAALTRKLTAALTQRVTTGDEDATRNPMGGAGSGSGRQAAAAAPAATATSGNALLIMGVTSDGRVWRWDAALPALPARSFLTSTVARPVTDISGSLQQAAVAQRGAPEPVAPQLVGLLQSLAGPITALHMHPRLVAMPPLKGAAAAVARRASTAGSGGGAAAAAADQGWGQDPPAAADPAATPPADPFAELAGLEGGTEPAAPAAADAPRAPAACLLAAGTSTGHVQLILVRRGLLNPLAPEVALCLAVQREPVGGVRWLGQGPRLVSYSSERAGHGGFRNCLAITDVRSRRSVMFRDGVASDQGPIRGIRASPSGAHLLILFTGSPPELWAIPSSLVADAAAAGGDAAAAAAAAPVPPIGEGGDGEGDAEAGGGQLPPQPEAEWAHAKPFRLRLVDLPFTAVEWARPEGTWRAAAAAGPLTWPRDMGREAASSGAPPAQGDAGAAAGAAGSWQARVVASLPEELLAFSLSDSRSGLLRVRGSKLTDVRPKRPFDAVRGAMLDMVATAVAARGTMVCMGDGDGDLLWWDTGSGHAQVIATGMGPVRRLQLAPPPCQHLLPHLAGGAGAAPVLRVAAAFEGGAFGVFEVDAGGRFRQGHAGMMACARAGRMSDLAWLPLPAPVGGGSVLAGATQDGSLCLVDVTQSPEATPSYRGRQRRLRRLLAHADGGGGDMGSVAARSARGTRASFDLGLRAGSSTTGAAASPSRLGSLSSAAAAGSAAGRGSSADAGAAATAAAGAWMLAPAQPVVCSLLMPRPWVLLLRALIQAGVPRDCFMALSSAQPDEEGDAELAAELAAALPEPPRAMLAPASQLQRRPTGSLGPFGAGGLSDRLASMSLPVSTPPAGLSGSPLSNPPPSKGLSVEPSKGLSAEWSSRQTAASLAPASSVSSEMAGSLLLPLAAGAGDAAGAPFDGDLVGLLRQVAALRVNGQLLLSEEWTSYCKVLGSGLVAERMAVAARISGAADEARFWAHLPATLAHVRPMLDFVQTRQRQEAAEVAAAARQSMQGAAAGAAGADAGGGPEGGGAAQTQTAGAGAGGGDGGESGHPLVAALEQDSAGYGRLFAAAPDPSSAQGPSSGAAGGGVQARDGSPRRGSALPGHAALASGAADHFSPGGAIKRVQTGRAVRLWDESLALADAQERTLWREAMARSMFDHETLQERRLLEYVVLGDFQTAVAFLLASPPELSVRFYRDAVVTLALAATASLRAQGSGGGAAQRGAAASASATLHLQAAKVVSAHAASVGDLLLGVPLNCSAGLHADAANTLQDAGLWRYGSVLTAAALRGTERAQALHHWAQHVRGAEGSVWRAAGLLTAAGCLRAALGVLRDAGLPDCAAAYAQACRQAGLVVPSPAAASPKPGGAAGDPRPSHAGSSSGGGGAAAPEQADLLGMDDWSQQGAGAGGGKAAAAAPPPPSEQLFDLIGQRGGRGLLRGGGGAEPVAAQDELNQVSREYEQYLVQLLGSL